MCTADVPPTVLVGSFPNQSRKLHHHEHESDNFKLFAMEIIAASRERDESQWKCMDVRGIGMHVYVRFGMAEDIVTWYTQPTPCSLSSKSTAVKPSMQGRELWMDPQDSLLHWARVSLDHHTLARTRACNHSIGACIEGGFFYTTQFNFMELRRHVMRTSHEEVRGSCAMQSLAPLLGNETAECMHC